MSPRSPKTAATHTVSTLTLLTPLGLYLEGARYNQTTKYLDESKPKQLYTELPMLWFIPKKNRKKPETVSVSYAYLISLF